MARARRQAQRKETGVKGARILVVEARYYDDIADMLLRGAKRVLKDAGAAFDLVTVPGALEIPAAIMIGLHAAAAREQPYDGVVALGCVIRGETSHYDIVAGEIRARHHGHFDRARHAGRQRHPDRRYRRAGEGARAPDRPGQRRRRRARRARR